MRSIQHALMLEAIHLMKQKNKYRIPQGIIIKNPHTKRRARKRSKELLLAGFFLFSKKMWKMKMMKGNDGKLCKYLSQRRQMINQTKHQLA